MFISFLGQKDLIICYDDGGKTSSLISLEVKICSSYKYLPVKTPTDNENLTFTLSCTLLSSSLINVNMILLSVKATNMTGSVNLHFVSFGTTFFEFEPQNILQLSKLSCRFFILGVYL